MLLIFSGAEPIYVQWLSTYIHHCSNTMLLLYKAFYLLISRDVADALCSYIWFHAILENHTGKDFNPKAN